MIQHATTVDRVHREDTAAAYQQGVEFAIQIMHERLAERLTLDNLARAAFMSRFHFARVFSAVTGVSPARFLAAVRMQEAKRLLLQSQRTVTAISLDVGYNSLGTFTRTFSDFVGYPPGTFRRCAVPWLQMPIKDMATCLSTQVHSIDADVRLNVRMSYDGELPLPLTIVGAFASRVPRNRPDQCVALGTADQHAVFDSGTNECSHLCAVGLTAGATLHDALLGRADFVRVGVVTLDSSSRVQNITIHLRHITALDPPIVLAFPILFLEKYMDNALAISEKPQIATQATV